MVVRKRFAWPNSLLSAWLSFCTGRKTLMMIFFKPEKESSLALFETQFEKCNDKVFRLKMDLGFFVGNPTHSNRSFMKTKKSFLGTLDFEIGLLSLTNFKLLSVLEIEWAGSLNKLRKSWRIDEESNSEVRLCVFEFPFQLIAYIQ